MRTFKVYLAGPIAGQTYDQSEDWRNFVAGALPKEIVPYSPLRGKEFLREAGVLGKGSYDENPLSTSKGVLTRDRNDVQSSDCVLINVLDAKKVSIGTIMEMAYADAYRVPVVLVMEPGNPHEHVMFDEAATYRTDSLHDAIDLVTYLLLPGKSPASQEAEQERAKKIAAVQQALRQSNALLKEVAGR